MGRERRFGQLTEPTAELLTYGSYLKIPELLSLQQLRSDPPVHDELLFIVVHQAYELWFKQLLFELESVRDRMFAGDAERARHYLVRVHAIERVLIEHIEVLAVDVAAGLPGVPHAADAGRRGSSRCSSARSSSSPG